MLSKRIKRNIKVIAIALSLCILCKQMPVAYDILSFSPTATRKAGLSPQHTRQDLRLKGCSAGLGLIDSKQQKMVKKTKATSKTY